MVPLGIVRCCYVGGNLWSLLEASAACQITKIIKSPEDQQIVYDVKMSTYSGSEPEIRVIQVQQSERQFQMHCLTFFRQGEHFPRLHVLQLVLLEADSRSRRLSAIEAWS